jgi:hypothetical protein
MPRRPINLLHPSLCLRRYTGLERLDLRQALRQFRFQLGHAPLERCQLRRQHLVAPWLAPVAFTVSALVRVMAAVAVAVMPNAW